ncbi:uncharacterized protein Z518_07670 [Rhinocladiella mackenziei CBS 650.93]|uniref:DASH complex subunit DAD2 n=1 Tax=Rhinocladiella mackenziei CBS 650.93 TaxID=1442369 RepID=A0A0D2FPJ7_9EURO|nr:uncharacterized protein Z518_07670 [Rhinocladiella mackenziei CBS 650.93]KIX04117.1 hypothetical protein Z518_07670 [Rhinocladiella mackenziei CBS 650.93]
MSSAPRPTSLYSSSNTSNTSALRPSSQLQSHSQSALQTRINAKRTELENLRQLRDLSANLAGQLAALEQKLSTLRNGTQSVALVLANWENVLGAISMAATKIPKPPDEHDADAQGNAETERKMNTDTVQELPVPLVRIPVQSKTEDGG